jgi:hypothetical protein
MKKRPTPETVASVLLYNPETGCLTWKERTPESFNSKKTGEAIRWNNRYAGKPAFTATMGSGYKCGAINKIVMQAHVVAWCLHFGDWPKKEIDHINGQRDDNRIKNLREVTKQENARNSKMPSNNTSGVVGVSYCKRDKVWIAHIASKRISSHKEKSMAVNARKEAEAKMKFHENHGRK